MIMMKRILLLLMLLYPLFNKSGNTYKTGDATTYLYGSLENDFYMKIPEEFRVPEAQTSNSQEVYSVK